MTRDRLAYILSIPAGLLLWSAAAYVSEKREPWDSDLYWTLFYPLAVLLSGIFGAIFGERPWRWALCVIFAQLAVMAASGPGSGSNLGLLPLGAMMLAILSVPAIGLALLAAKLRRRF
jgi:hypothetical protein